MRLLIVSFFALLTAAGAQAQTAQDERCWDLVQRDAKAALAMAADTLREAGAKGDARAQLHARLCRGYALERSGRRAEAMAEYEASVAQARKLHEDQALARALAMRGDQLAYYGAYADALADLKAAYDVNLATANEAGQRLTLNVIANLYADRRVKDYDKALEYYRKLLVFNERAQDPQSLATSHYNIASTLEAQGKLEEALSSFGKALEIDQSRGVEADVAYDERSVGIVLSKLGRHVQALQTLNRAYARPGQEEEQLAMIALSRGVAQRRAGHFSAARMDIEAARAYFGKEKNLRFLDTIEDERALTLAGLGDYPGALEARNEQMKVREELNAQLLDDRSARLRVQFQSEQQKLENQSLERELAHNADVRRWQFAALIGAAIALLALGVLAMRQFRMSQRMHDLAMTDELTRLPNRRHFMALADSAMQYSLKSNVPVALAALDIDFFKKINDTYGHAVGDVVLQRVAHAMRMALRPGDAIGRVGGEEFLAVLRGASLADAVSAAERLRLAVQSLDCRDLHPNLAPTISLGVAARTGAACTLAELCKQADDALYRAKGNGRNRVEAWIEEEDGTPAPVLA